MEPNLKKNRLFAFCIALAFFAAIAPTLPWQEFSSGPENLVVATAQEMRRGGSWLVPTLQGEPRIAKPPLAAWITAAAITRGTLHDVDARDFYQRGYGFHWLAFQSRWPALLAACLLILGVFELGTAIGDSTLGLRACAICASSYFLLRFARYSTTDIHLALWVTWGNVFLARLILRGKVWSGFVGAGITLGLAMMSKGPVALVQSIVPMLVYVILRRLEARRLVRLAPAASRGFPDAQHEEIEAALASEGPRVGAGAKQDTLLDRRAIIPMLVGALIFLVIGCWWFIIVFLRTDHVAGRWFSEVTRVGATDTPASSIFSYLAIVGFVVPWTGFSVVGLIVSVKQLMKRAIAPESLVLLLLIVPLLVMTLAKDRQDRYALPMLPAASIVVAIGVAEYLKRWSAPAAIDRAVAGLHWLTLAAIAVILPLIGATPLLKQATGEPWFTWQFAVMEASLGALLIAIGMFRHRTRPAAIVNCTLIVMLIAQAVVFKGYCSSAAGRSELRELADMLTARYPDAQYYNAHPTGKRPPTDLGVYLNRTIRRTSDPSTIERGEYPSVLFMRQNKGDPDFISPPGWNFVQRTKRDKDWWWAFVLPPS